MTQSKKLPNFITIENYKYEVETYEHPHTNEICVVLNPITPAVDICSDSAYSETLIESYGYRKGGHIYRLAVDKAIELAKTLN